MYDLIKLVFAQIPKYISNFANLLSHPKRFIRKKSKLNDLSLTEALTFYGISFVLAFILKTPFILGSLNPWQYIGTRGLYDLIWLALYAATLGLSWRLVGGRAPFLKFFIAVCYFDAVIGIVLSVTRLLGVGVVKFWDPELYDILVGAYRSMRLSNPGMNAYMAEAVREAQSGSFGKFLLVVVFELILLGGCLVALAWVVAGWGALREFTGISKKKSFFAGVIFILLAAIVFLFLYLILFALS
jgi:hypothetical protein